MLNDKIQTDLNELSSNGVIRNALKLNGLVIAKPGQTSFATKALPGYYVGKRDAQTVMVMLNHGIDVCKANNNLQKDIKTRGMGSINDVNNYHNSSANFGHFDKNRYDVFDVKVAFFIKNWPNNGISLPAGLCPQCNKQTKLDAKEAVLTDKLQLELIPYASSQFKGFDKKRISEVFPFVDILFDEIFSCDRKYVIFCSRFFEQVFKAYEKAHPGHIKFRNINVPPKCTIPNLKFQVSCHVIEITYNGKTMKAIIANTFPNQSLTNAYDRMEDYGTFCYQEYIKP